MSLSTDLLAQAKYILDIEPKRPKQASLRRAVSTAYYSFFHLLVQDGALLMFGGGNAIELRHVVRRAYEHGTMKKAAKGFASGQLAAAWNSVLPNPSAELTMVANAFVDLQEARHQADYDPTYKLKRSEARDLVERAESAIEAWKKVRKDNNGKAYSLESKVFLAAILMHKQISGRSSA